MLQELRLALQKWRLVHLLGLSVLRARYARSYLGQFWLTITTLLQVVIVGVVWSVLWRVPVASFLPHYGVGFVLFSLSSRMIGESSTVLVADSNYYANDRLPFMVSILALLYREGIIFLHNLPVVVLLALCSDSASPGLSIAILPAAALSCLFLFFSGYFVAVMCARFRDLVQITSMIVQNAFLVSPIIWRADALPARYLPYLFLNPFAAILETIRNPLIGLPVEPLAYPCLAGWTAVALAFAWLAHRRFAARLVFWI